MTHQLPHGVEKQHQQSDARSSRKSLKRLQWRASAASFLDCYCLRAQVQRGASSSYSVRALIYEHTNESCRTQTRDELLHLPCANSYALSTSQCHAVSPSNAALYSPYQQLSRTKTLEPGYIVAYSFYLVLDRRRFGLQTRTRAALPLVAFPGKMRLFWSEKRATLKVLPCSLCCAPAQCIACTVTALLA